jgi:hypothetical protein
VVPALATLEAGIRKRSRRIVSPRWVGAALTLRPLVQRLVELQVRRGIGRALDIARTERPEPTTRQPG